MSGLLTITVQEARGAVAIPADIDQLAVVIGCTSAGSGLSPFFLSGKAAQDAVGYGDAVDVLTQMIEQRQKGDPAPKRAVAIYSTPSDADGSYGAIDVTGVTGTSVVTTDALSQPRGTYEAELLVVAGGTIGTAGITLRWSLDGGRTLSPVTALGVATSYTIPNSNVKFDFAVGTLEAGNTVTVRTKGPQPGAQEVLDAFTAIAQASIDMSIVVIEMDMTAALGVNVTTGLNSLAAVGKDCCALVRTDIPDAETSETEIAWLTAVAADWANFTDSRVCKRAAYGLVTDAMTGRQYLRSDLADFAANVIRVPRFVWPNAPADRPMPDVSLVDADGVTVGHDEGPRGAATGLSNETLGHRFSTVQRLPDPQRREDVYNAVPWVAYAADERIRNLMTRRLANAMKRAARSAGTPGLGSVVFYDSTGPTTGTLTTASRDAVQGRIYQVISTEFKDEIGNADDAAVDSGLVQVNPSVTISGGNLVQIPLTLAPKVGGFVLSLDMTLAIQE